MATQEEIDAFFAHHGVLGMHWGVRKVSSNEEEGRDSKATGNPKESGAPASPKVTKTAADASVEKAENLSFKTTPPVNRSPEAAKKNIHATALNSEYKYQPSESGNHKLSPKQKKELETAAAVASAGAVIALGVYALKKNPGILNHVAPGSHVEPSEFKDLVDFTKSQAWGDHESIVKTPFNSHDLTLPAGQGFHRLSTSAEHSFGDATYATFKPADFARYAAGGTTSIDRSNYQHISWNAKDSVKIPSLENALNIFRDTMVDEYKTLSPEQKANRKMYASALDPENPKEWLSAENIVSQYRQKSGGAWNSGISKSFITNLKAHGYDGLIDENDSAVLTESPVVLFSHEKMGPKSSSKLTTENLMTLKNGLTELTHRKYEMRHSIGMVEMTDDVDEFLAHFSSERRGKRRRKIMIAGDPDPKVEEFLAHFGVKGMHWGERNESSRAEERVAKTDRKIVKTEANIEAHKKAISNIKSHIKDANENGVDSELFKQTHGGTASPALFMALHGTTINKALEYHKEDLQNALADSTFSRDVNQTHLERLQKRRTRLAARINK